MVIFQADCYRLAVRLFQNLYKNIATTLAILAAALYAINVPISKLLMEHISATMMAGLLYFFQFAHVTITEHMVNAKYGTKITNGPRVQMQTAGSKKKEDWTEVSKEQLAEVKLPASFEKLKEQKSYFYHGENISDYELVQTAVALGKMELPTDEKKCIPDRAAMDAFEVLVRDQASGLTLTFLY